MTAALLTLLLAAAPGDRAVWVHFADKGPQDPSVRLTALVESYPARALERRRLRRAAPGLVDERDLPVWEGNLDAVRELGCEPRHASPWLNAVSVRADESMRARLAQLPGVTHVRPVGQLDVARAPVSAPTTASAGPFYGLSEDQLAQIALTDLHARGYTGAGVVIGVLDTGFRRSHAAFQFAGHPLQVVDEWDFVDDDANTAPEPGDASDQHDHGTWILGTMGAYLPGTLVGGAYDASFALAKVEDLASETAIEEDWFIAGLEWLERNGADVVTSSLIIRNVYSFDELDGLTAASTIALSVAAENGVHAFQGAGNEGHDADPSTNSLHFPADAVHTLTVGAVDDAGATATFSSDGPTVDGRLKPEILARGVAVWTVSSSNDSGAVQVSGTSLATPLCAAACACLVQAHPDWTVDQMRAALTHTARGYVADGAPDPLFVRGFGVLEVDAAEGESDPLVYCAAKRNSVGCLPTLAFDGVPSASAPDPFEVRAGFVLRNQPGILFYGTSGAAALPFQGGTLCLSGPFRRLPVQNSAGAAAPHACTGAFDFDLNAWIQSGVDPALVAGAELWAQLWWRDPADAFGTGTSAAIELTIGP